MVLGGRGSYVRFPLRGMKCFSFSRSGNKTKRLENWAENEERSVLALCSLYSEVKNTAYSRENSVPRRKASKLLEPNLFTLPEFPEPLLTCTNRQTIK